MIAIATETYDVAGHKVFENSDREEILNESGARRCTRTATLDGGCEVYDTGYTDSDRVIQIHEKDASQSMIDYVKYIIKNYSSIIVAVRDGVFKGVPGDYKYSDNVLMFNILVTERISS